MVFTLFLILGILARYPVANDIQQREYTSEENMFFSLPEEYSGRPEETKTYNKLDDFRGKFGVSYETFCDTIIKKQPRKPEDKLGIVQTRLNKWTETVSQSGEYSFESFWPIMIGSESSGKASARAEGTTATGIAQITAPTWKAYARGVPFSEATNPTASKIVAQRIADDYASKAARSLGRHPSNLENYGFYFMGPKTADKFFNKNDNVKVDTFVPRDALLANKSVFYRSKIEKGKRVYGEARTVGETKEELATRFARHIPKVQRSR